MEIGTLRLHAFAIDDAGDIKNKTAGTMGVFDPTTNILIIPVKTDLDYIVVGKENEIEVSGGRRVKSTATGGDAYSPAISGTTGNDYVSVATTADLVVGAMLLNGVTELGIIVAKSDTKAFLDRNLSGDLVGITTGKQLYTEISMVGSDNNGWMTDEDVILPGDAITIYDGISLGEFTGVTVDIAADPIEYKGQHKYARHVAYSGMSCNLTIDELAVNKYVLSYINGYASTNDESDDSISILDNPYSKANKPIDVKLIGVRALTKEDGAMTHEMHVWEKVKGASFTLSNSKDSFSTESKELMCMEKSTANDKVYTIYRI